MKKKYGKPDILFESFSMSTNIAGVCEYSPNLSKGTCGVSWMEGLFVIFTTTETGCTRKVEDGSENYDGLCYHVPTADRNVFNS